MDEFLNGDFLTSMLYNIYRQTRGTIFYPYVDEVPFFNELYYQLTRYYYEKPGSKDYPRYYADIRTNLGRVECADLVMAMMYSYCQLRDHQFQFRMDSFMKTIQLNLANTGILSFFETKPSVVRWIDIVPYPKKPCPVAPVKLTKMNLDWSKITRNFNTKVIKELLDLWDNKEEKRAISGVIMNNFLLMSDFDYEKQSSLIKLFSKVLNNQDDKSASSKLYENNRSEKKELVEASKSIAEYNKNKDLEERDKEILQLKKENKRLEEELVKAKELDKKRIEEIDKWHGSYEDSCKASDVWQAQYEEAEDKIKIAEHEKKESEKLKQENVELRVKIAQLQSQLEEEKTNLKTCVSTSQLKLTNNSNFARVVQAMVSARYFKRANGDETNATEVGSMLLKLFGVSNTWKSVLQKAFSRENPLKTFDDLRDAGANYWANRSGLTEDIRKKGKK